MSYENNERRNKRSRWRVIPARCIQCGNPITYENILWRRNKSGEIIGAYSYCKPCKALQNKRSRVKKSKHAR